MTHERTCGRCGLTYVLHPIIACDSCGGIVVDPRDAELVRLRAERERLRVIEAAAMAYAEACETVKAALTANADEARSGHYDITMARHHTDRYYAAMAAARRVELALSEVVRALRAER